MESSTLKNPARPGELRWRRVEQTVAYLKGPGSEGWCRGAACLAQTSEKVEASVGFSRRERPRGASTFGAERMTDEAAPPRPAANPRKRDDTGSFAGSRRHLRQSRACRWGRGRYPLVGRRAAACRSARFAEASRPCVPLSPPPPRSQNWLYDIRQPAPQPWSSQRRV